MNLPRPEDLVGTRLPELTFRFRDGSRWIERSTADLFAGKTVVAFGLPGAFTPTCSSSHVPRYDELAEHFAANGVDDVMVISVNDPFVMQAWEQDQGTRRVTYLPDGNGDLTDALGLLVDKSDLRFGKRSWRYAMVVEDGVVAAAFVEPDKPGDPFEVSDADSVLAWFDEQAAVTDVAMIGRAGCSHCDRAKAMLAEAGLPYAWVEASPRNLRAFSGRLTTPQVFVNGAHIGGADELGEWLAKR